jgi:peptidyl-prolyl cis-trans isomerase B (cyclophilin B)
MFKKSKWIFFSSMILILTVLTAGCATNGKISPTASSTKATGTNAKTDAPTATPDKTASVPTVEKTAEPTENEQPTVQPTSQQTPVPTATPVPTPRIPRTFENDPDTYPIVTIEMQNGDKIVAELYPYIAPNTVLNFISLINKGFYNGLIFHRVKPGFMIQGGDPKGIGTGNAGYSIDGEFTNNGFTNNLSHVEGVFSMARGGANMNSASSQFFIMAATATYLDGNYASFGKVISGQNIVTKIVSVPRDATDKPLTDQVIKTITVDTKGVVYPEPYTNPIQ